ncbi:MAG: DUF4288 domain-containing protein [Planctomycetaceae bacterium]
MRTQHVFAAKLLFQFHVVARNGNSDRRRLTEERIVVFHAREPRSALTAAKSLGRAGETNYPNDHGDDVRFEFVGILDLQQLGVENDQHEVWYELRYRMTPMERRQELIPSDAILVRRAT